MGLRGPEFPPEEMGRFPDQHGALGTNLFLPPNEEAGPESHSSFCFCGFGGEAGVAVVRVV